MSASIPVASPPILTPSIISSKYLVAENIILKGTLVNNGGTITGLADPTQLTEPATKNYVDNAVNNKKWKDPVRVATTIDITLSGAQTIDGVAVVADDRVLVKDQTDTIQNGIYVASSTAWSRSVDMAVGSAAAGVSMWVNEGAAGGDKSFICTDNTGADVVGTDGLTFIELGDAATITAGDGLTLTGSTLSVNVDNSTIEISTNTVQVKDLGITNAKLTNSALTVDGNGLASTGAITLGGSGTASVNVDNSTIEISADTVQVKNSGISNAKLANTIITFIGTGLDFEEIALGATGTSNINVDDATIEIAADALHLKDTAVTAASYTNTNITVDAQGRLTAASTGTNRVMITGALDNFLSSTRFVSWGTTPGSSSITNSFLLGKAGTITNITATYVYDTAVSLDPGDTITIDVGEQTANNPNGNFSILTGGSAVIVWDDTDNGTWPSESAAVSISVLATTKLAIRVPLGGTPLPANSILNVVLVIEI